MLNIDHGVLNPCSLIEIEKQSQIGDVCVCVCVWGEEGEWGVGGVNPFSKKLGHSTNGGQHSQYRKSAKGIDLSTPEGFSRTSQQAFSSPPPPPTPQTRGGRRPRAQGSVVTPYLYKLVSQHRAANYLLHGSINDPRPTQYDWARSEQPLY